MDVKKVKTSGYGMVDISNARKELKRSFADVNPPIGRPIKGYPVTITGYLLGPVSGDDGTSIEFQLDIRSFKLEPMTNLLE